MATDQDPPAHPGAPLIVLLLALGTGVVAKVFLYKTRIPYTALLFCGGLIVGASVDWKDSKKPIFRAVRAWDLINPHVILFVFLPILIFESAFSVDFHTLYRQAKQVILLALPGVAFCAGLTATVLRFLYGKDQHFTWTASLMLGSILSATDPVAVVALMKDLGVTKKLGTLLEGESLANDGTAIVLFNVFFEALKEKGSAHTLMSKPLKVSFYFLRLAVGGPIFGACVGLVTSYMLGYIYDDSMTEIALTIFAAFGTFLTAEMITVNNGEQLTSGVLAVVFLGLILGTRGKARISATVERELHAVWELLSFVANTTVFFVAGLIVADRMARDSFGADLWKVLVIYVSLHGIRGVMLLLSWPFLRRWGYGMPGAHLTSLWWGGLRGAVSLTLALMVEEQRNINQEVRDQTVFVVAGITCLTLVVNGTTMEFLLNSLGLSDASDQSRKAFEALAAELSSATDVYTSDVALTDRYIADAEWGVVARYLPCHDAGTYAARRRTIRRAGAPHTVMAARWRKYKGLFETKAAQKGGLSIELQSETPARRARRIAATDDALSGELKAEVVMTDAEDPSSRSSSATKTLSEHRRRALLVIKSTLWQLLEQGYMKPSAFDALSDAVTVSLDDVAAGNALESSGFKRRILPALERFEADELVSKHAEGGNSWGEQQQENTSAARKACYEGVTKSWLRWKLSFLFEVASNYARACETVAKELARGASDSQLEVVTELLQEARAAEFWIDENLERWFPRLTKSLKTEIATRVALTREASNVTALYRSGRLDDRERAALRRPLAVSLRHLDLHPTALEPTTAARHLMKVLTANVEYFSSVSDETSADLGGQRTTSTPGDVVSEDDDALAAKVGKLAAGAKEKYFAPGDVVLPAASVANAWCLVVSGALNDSIDKPSATNTSTKGPPPPEEETVSAKDAVGPVGLCDCVARAERAEPVAAISWTRAFVFDFEETSKVATQAPRLLHALLCASYPLHDPDLLSYLKGDDLLSRSAVYCVPALDSSMADASPTTTTNGGLKPSTSSGSLKLSTSSGNLAAKEKNSRRLVAHLADSARAADLDDAQGALLLRGSYPTRPTSSSDSSIKTNTTPPCFLQFDAPGALPAFAPGSVVLLLLPPAKRPTAGVLAVGPGITLA